MKLRYIEIDPDVIAELPDWSRLQIERENERTLKDLGITRQANESYLLAWVRTVLAENGCEDNPENRQRLIEAIRQDWKAQLFVWVLGGDERKAFGVDDSPAFQEHLVRHHAARSLAPGCFYDHNDPRYWDYQPQARQQSGASDANLSKLNTVVWPLFIMLACLVGGWLLAAGWDGRIILLIFMTGWVAAYFHRSFRRETWPEQLGFAFLGGVGLVWLVMFLAGTVVPWLMPWQWPLRLGVSLFFGGLFATSMGQVWKALRRSGIRSAGNSTIRKMTMPTRHRPSR